MGQSQALYNSLVEPFNAIETTRRQNSINLTEASNKLKQNEKTLEDMRAYNNILGKLNNY